MMNKRSTTCSRCSHGLTLIEVVAAIAILGTLIAGIVMARSRHRHQLALTRRKSAAVRVADALLTDWWAVPGGVPVGESGLIPTDKSLRWETRRVINSDIEALGADVVRVEIHEAEPPPSTENPVPLLTVDLVVSRPEGEPESREESEGEAS
jgi:prepilin-type N-terminal cleavage/methylation domain-containing protein